MTSPGTAARYSVIADNGTSLVDNAVSSCFGGMRGRYSLIGGGPKSFREAADKIKAPAKPLKHTEELLALVKPLHDLGFRPNYLQLEGNSEQWIQQMAPWYRDLIERSFPKVVDWDRARIDLSHSNHVVMLVISFLRMPYFGNSGHSCSRFFSEWPAILEEASNLSIHRWSPSAYPLGALTLIGLAGPVHSVRRKAGNPWRIGEKPPMVWTNTITDPPSVKLTLNSTDEHYPIHASEVSVNQAYNLFRRISLPKCLNKSPGFDLVYGYDPGWSTLLGDNPRMSPAGCWDESCQNSPNRAPLTTMLWTIAELEKDEDKRYEFSERYSFIPLQRFVASAFKLSQLSREEF